MMPTNRRQNVHLRVSHIMLEIFVFNAFSISRKNHVSCSYFNAFFFHNLVKRLRLTNGRVLSITLSQCALGRVRQSCGLPYTWCASINMMYKRVLPLSCVLTVQHDVTGLTVILHIFWMFTPWFNMQYHYIVFVFLSLRQHLANPSASCSVHVTFCN